MRTESDNHGRVVARHRRHITIITDDGEHVVCLAHNRHLDVLVGDRVEWRIEADGTPVVSGVLPRDSLLTRIDSRGRREPVAANLTQLVIVIAARPPADWLLVDRYLAAAELIQVKPLIVFNKCDLSEMPDELAAYRHIGMATLATSTLTHIGLDILAARLDGERSAMLGQSGVGKSSLINSLLGTAAQSVGGLTDKGGHGRHTTTTAVCYDLAGGGELVDTPGVRHYTPYIEDSAEAARGFREFQALIGRCRFSNCRHAAEPGCAIKEAVAEGAIDRRRYDSYIRLSELVVGLRAVREP